MSIINILRGGGIKTLVKTAWFFIGISILMLVGITLLLVFPASELLKKEASNLQLQIVEKARREVSFFFDNNFHHLTHLAKASAVIGDFQGKEILVKEFLGHAMVEIIYLDKLGQEKIRVSTSKEFSPSELKDRSRTEEFLQAKQGKQFVSGVFWENEVPFVIMAAPILSIREETHEHEDEEVHEHEEEVDEEEVEGVLVTKLSLEELEESLYKIKLGETGIIYVVGKQGSLLFHPQGRTVFEGINLLERRPIRAVIRDGRRVTGLDHPADFYINEKGVEVHVVGILFPEFFWGVFLEQETSESYSARNQLLTFAGILLVIGFLLSYLLSRFILSLTKTSKELQKAKDTLEMEKKTLEIRVKSRTIELTELTEGLEEKVKKRTEEIQKRVEELEKFHKLTIGRELKMIELKKEIEKLKKELEEKSGKS